MSDIGQLIPPDDEFMAELDRTGSPREAFRRFGRTSLPLIAPAPGPAERVAHVDADHATDQPAFAGPDLAEASARVGSPEPVDATSTRDVGEPAVIADQVRRAALSAGGSRPSKARRPNGDRVAAAAPSAPMPVPVVSEIVVQPATGREERSTLAVGILDGFLLGSVPIGDLRPKAALAWAWTVSNKAEARFIRELCGLVPAGKRLREHVSEAQASEVGRRFLRRA